MSAKKIMHSFRNFNYFRSVRAVSFALLSILISPALHAAANQPITDDEFVREAFAGAKSEIILSQIALDKSRNSGVKKIANTIIKDNNAANQQLRELADARRLEVPTALDKDDQQQIDRLRSVDKEGVDRAYREKIQQTHSVAMELFDRVAKNPRSDAEFRVFATKRLALYKKHSQMIDKLNLAPAKVAQR